MELKMKWHAYQQLMHFGKLSLEDDIAKTMSNKSKKGLG